MLSNLTILILSQTHFMKKNFRRTFIAANQNGWHKCILRSGNITASVFLNYLIYVNLIYGKNIGNSLRKFTI